MIKGKTPEGIRKTFNIVNCERLHAGGGTCEENKWCEEA